MHQYFVRGHIMKNKIDDFGFFGEKNLHVERRSRKP
jgi:hypothetical protein